MTALKQNLGSKDRALRIIAGIAMIAVGITFQTWFGAIGLIFLATAMIGWCPLYLPLRLSTKHPKA